MRRRTKIILVLGALLLLAVGWVVFKPEKEPVYQGKKLSQWILQTLPDPVTGSPPPPAELDAARIAIRTIGTEAIPMLLKWISYEEPIWIKEDPNPGDALLGYLDGQLGKLGRRTRTDNLALSWGAVKAFEILGPAAESASPALTGYFQEAKDFDLFRRTAAALTYIAPAATGPFLSSLLSKEDPRLREAAIFALRYTANRDTNFLNTIPGLIACLHETNRYIVSQAARALGNLNLSPEQVIPALTETALTQRRWARFYAIEALGHYGRQASNALPTLLQMLKNDDFLAQREATNAILKIDANALPK